MALLLPSPRTFKIVPCAGVHGVLLLLVVLVGCFLRGRGGSDADGRGVLRRSVEGLSTEGKDEEPFDANEDDDYVVAVLPFVGEGDGAGDEGGSGWALGARMRTSVKPAFGGWSRPLTMMRRSAHTETAVPRHSGLYSAAMLVAGST